MPSAFFCPIRTSSRLPRVIPTAGNSDPCDLWIVIEYPNACPTSYDGRSTNDHAADQIRAQLQICALAKKGAGVHFNLQSVDNCPFFLHVLDWGLLIEIQATAGIG